MSKNLTRKGLALGVTAALASTLFAGAPAFAVDPVSLEPNAGTTYATLVGETFTLKSQFTDAAQVGSENVKFQVTDSTDSLSTAAYTAATAGGVTTVADVAGEFHVTDSTAHVLVVSGGATQAPAASTLALVADAAAITAASTFTVSVKAWLDYDNDDVIDTTGANAETVSAAQTVTFVKAADVTWTTEFTTPVIGDTKFLSYVSANNNINMAQVADHVSVLFANTTDAGEDGIHAFAASDIDATSGKLKSNVLISALTGEDFTNNYVTGGKRYTAQALYKLAGSEAAADAKGSAVAYSVAAATVTGIAAAATANSDDFKTATTNVAVRETVTSVPVSFTVTGADTTADVDTDADPLAGIPVVVTIEENAAGGTDASATSFVGNNDAARFTAGGATLADASSSATAEKITFTVTSGSDGKAAFTLAALNAKAGDAVKISAKAQGVDSAAVQVYTWTAPTVASVANTNITGTLGVIKAAAGSTVNLNYAVLDNFGALLKSGDYRLAVAFNSETKYPAVSGGKATASFALASTATGTINVAVGAVDVQVKGTDGNYADIAGAGAVANTVAQSVVVGTSNAAASIDLTGDITTVDTFVALSATAANTLVKSGRTSVLNTTAFVAGDSRLGSNPAVAGLLASGVTVAGTVKDSTTAGTQGSVTFSGSGLDFIVANTQGGYTYSKGSVTIQTAADGTFSEVQVVSSIAGKHTLVATSGSATKSAVLDFGVAAAADAATYSIEGLTKVAVGRTLVLTPTAVDKFGNKTAEAIAAADITYDGPGLTVNTPTTANSAFRVLLGAGDTGIATLTVKFKGADDTAGTVDDVTVVKTVIIGVSASVSAGSKKATAVVKNAYGLTVKVVSGSKAITKVATSDSYNVTLSKLTSGSKTVKVYVNDVLVASKKVTVKK